MRIVVTVALSVLLIACEEKAQSATGTAQESEDAPSTGSSTQSRADPQPGDSDASVGPANPEDTPDPSDALTPDDTPDPADTTGPDDRPSSTPSESSAPSTTTTVAEEPDGPPSLSLPAEVAACREYFETICTRIRQCGAPIFRPCESPVDLCPDILFDPDSSWTLDAVQSCTETWKTHSCEALGTDQWPECSAVPGARGEEADCAFDAQCASGRCVLGVVPLYDKSCGVCTTPQPVDGECRNTLDCEQGLRCEAEVCVALVLPVGICDEGCPIGQECWNGSCREPVNGPLPQGAVCREVDECEEGLGCQIELVADAREGVCEPLPPIGEPCLPTFGSSGLCEAGGTCTNRPTGDCVPLREVGESCGFTTCVEGAHCQVFGDIVDDVPSHTCYAGRGVGEECFGINEMCAEGLGCICDDEACESHRCSELLQLGDSCGGVTELCAPPLRCRDASCTAVDSDETPEVAAVLGAPCTRFSDYGRTSGDCPVVDDTLECLCVDPACTASVCARPSFVGEPCDGETAVCRQGLLCTFGSCVALERRDIEAEACSP